MGKLQSSEGSLQGIADLPNFISSQTFRRQVQEDENI